MAQQSKSTLGPSICISFALHFPMEVERRQGNTMELVCDRGKAPSQVAIPHWRPKNPPNHRQTDRFPSRESEISLWRVIRPTNRSQPISRLNQTTRMAALQAASSLIPNRPVPVYFYLLAFS